MRLQVFSDLHLEFGLLELPESEADIIIAAGDVALGADGIQWLDTLGKPVVFVGGNHDYWYGDLRDRVLEFRAESHFTQVRYLENEVYEQDGVRFLGCTLWTDYHNQNSQVMKMVEMAVNDFRHISFDQRAMKPEDLVGIHQASKAWLAKELAKPYAGKTVVVTHHAPSSRSWFANINNDIRYAYCNDLEEWMGQFDIDLWVHGHVHKVSDYRCGETRVICNPRGYYNYQETLEFVSDKLIEL